jgi:hypothetical protein
LVARLVATCGTKSNGAKAGSPSIRAVRGKERPHLQSQLLE